MATRKTSETKQSQENAIKIIIKQKQNKNKTYPKISKTLFRQVPACHADGGGDADLLQGNISGHHELSQLMVPEYLQPATCAQNCASLHELTTGIEQPEGTWPKVVCTLSQDDIAASVNWRVRTSFTHAFHARITVHT